MSQKGPIPTDPKKVRHDWNQTNSELIITLYPGGNTKSLNIKDIKIETNETNCTVKFPGEKYWSSELYCSVLPEFTDIQQKANKIIIKMMKKAAGSWETLEPKQEKEQNSDTIEKEEIKKPVSQLSHLKHDFYEKSLDTLNLSIYVKRIAKESCTVSFEEERFLINFQTNDKQFLTTNNGTNNTLFEWSMNLKASIDPELCKYKLNDTKLELFFRKRVPSKWNGLEGVPLKIRAVEVPASTWLSPTTDIKLETNTSEDEKIDNTEKILNVEEPKKEIQQKPTCMVSPLSKNELSKQIRPGYSGLKNLGNTCFMNAVLQCLANTRELRDYFKDGVFQHDINVTNPLGMNGELAVAFAVLIRTLWLGNQPFYAPSKIKSLIGSKATQFSGFAQHDAQEFMAFFLDGLHEDLNRIKEKPYIEYSNADNKPDDVAAEESWENYKKRNDSIVVSLFQGQYKSKLLCPVCKKVSITFDPFLYLSLPLPKEHCTFSLYFFYKEPSRKPIHYQFRLPLDSRVSDLIQRVADESQVNKENLHFYIVYKQIHLKLLPPETPLSKVDKDISLFVYEVFDEKLVGEPVVELKVTQRLKIPPIKNCCSFCLEEKLPQEGKFKRCSKCQRVAYCDVTCQKSHWPKHQQNCNYFPVPVGYPFVFSLPKSQTTYSILSRVLEEFSSHFVNTFQPPVNLSAVLPANVASPQLDCNKGSTENEKAMSELDLSDQKPDHPKENPATTPPVRIVIGQQQDELSRGKAQFHIRAMDFSGPAFKDESEETLKDNGNEPVIKSNYTHLAMDWNNNEKSPNYVMVQSKEPDCDVDISQCETNEDGTLDDCLKLFTEPEILTSKDAWYCPNCKEHREATKQLSLWRLPPVLIVQLKRFSYGGFLHFREKLDKMIDFPIRNLDLSPYVCHSQTSSDSSPIYDLYAVVNHQGGILGGHYTAFARSVDLKDIRRSEVDWRHFDDVYVTSAPESTIVTEYAYVLFYRQRGYQFCPYNKTSLNNISKAQKERENNLDLEGKIEETTTTQLDSNIINYADNSPTDINNFD